MQAPTPLPRDLHVLSLPLAFILSQDQTLRCWYISFDILFQFCVVSRLRISAFLFIGTVRFDGKLMSFPVIVLSVSLVASLSLFFAFRPAACRFPFCGCKVTAVFAAVQALHAFFREISVFIPPFR